jgi:hypothetical protein
VPLPGLLVMMSGLGRRLSPELLTAVGASCVQLKNRPRPTSRGGGHRRDEGGANLAEPVRWFDPTSLQVRATEASRPRRVQRQVPNLLIPQSIGKACFYLQGERNPAQHRGRGSAWLAEGVEIALTINRAGLICPDK